MTSNKDIDEFVEYANTWCKECGEPYWTGTGDGFCDEDCKELHELDTEQEAYRKQEIERKERERFWQDRVFKEWLPEHMESWRKLQNLKKSSPPLVTRQR